MTDGQPIIVTFLSSLVKWIHLTHVMSHDNTYKQIVGDWKEWEIVAWIEALNMHKFHTPILVLFRVWPGY